MANFDSTKHHKIETKQNKQKYTKMNGFNYSCIHFTYGECFIFIHLPRFININIVCFHIKIANTRNALDIDEYNENCI